MLWVYVPRGTCLDRIPVTSDSDVPENAVWFDLVNPNLQEDKIVERQVGAAVPTREEMLEIEVTSRLYVENGARYMHPPRQSVATGYRRRHGPGASGRPRILPAQNRRNAMAPSSGVRSGCRDGFGGPPASDASLQWAAALPTFRRCGRGGCPA